MPTLKIIDDRKGLQERSGILSHVLHGTASSAIPYLMLLLLARGEEKLRSGDEEKAVPIQNTANWEPKNPI